MTQPLRVGVIGLSADAGWAARTHVPAIEIARGVTLSGLVASTPQTTGRAAARYGVTGFNSAQALVSSPDIDLVVVSVKTPVHERLVRLAIDNSKPIYCEWPLATSGSVAAELAALADQRGVPGFIGLQGRSSPVIRHIRDAVGAGCLGRPIMTTVDATAIMGGRDIAPRNLYQLDPRNGATVVTIAIGHLLDTMEYVFGPLAEVSAVTAVGYREVAVVGSEVPAKNGSIDHAAAVGQFASGALLSIVAHGGSRGGDGLVWWTRGTDGELTVRGKQGLPALTDLSVSYDCGSSAPARDVTGPAHAVQTLAAAYEGVAAALRGEASDVPGFAHAARLQQRLDELTRTSFR